MPLDGSEPDAKVETPSLERTLHVCLDGDQGAITGTEKRGRNFIHVPGSSRAGGENAAVSQDETTNKRYGEESLSDP